MCLHKLVAGAAGVQACPLSCGRVSNMRIAQIISKPGFWLCQGKQRVHQPFHGGACTVWGCWQCRPARRLPLASRSRALQISPSPIRDWDTALGLRAVGTISSSHQSQPSSDPSMSCLASPKDPQVHLLFGYTAWKFAATHDMSPARVSFSAQLVSQMNSPIPCHVIPVSDVRTLVFHVGQPTPRRQCCIMPISARLHSKKSTFTQPAWTKDDKACCVTCTIEETCVNLQA